MVIFCLKRLENDWDVKPQYKRTQAWNDSRSGMSAISQVFWNMLKDINIHTKKNECHNFVCGLKYPSLTIYESR